MNANGAITIFRRHVYDIFIFYTKRVRTEISHVANLRLLARSQRKNPAKYRTV